MNPFLKVLLLSLSLLLLPLKAEAHRFQIQYCLKAFNSSSHASTLVKDGVLQNGAFWFEEYEINTGKLKQRILALSIITHIDKQGTGEDEVITYQHAENPLFYVIDLDGDTNMDAVYIDGNVYGEKSIPFDCKKIRLYEDLTVPHSENTDKRRHGEM